MKRYTTSRKKRNNIIPDDLDKLLQQTENITLDEAEFNISLRPHDWTLATQRILAFAVTPDAFATLYTLFAKT